MSQFDRTEEDLGNIVALDHINTTIPDQRLATIFYIMGLGLTRDPYLVMGISNMWVNAGRSQFHLPTSEPQVLRGVTGLVVPDLDALEKRLQQVAGLLEGTAFAYRRGNDTIDVTSPWGNRFCCHRPGEAFGRMQLGIGYIAFDAPRGAAAGIARFYGDIMGAKASIEEGSEGAVARVGAGNGQALLFRERSSVADFDGHHVAIFIADFSGPHKWLVERGLITAESNQHQYRFVDIVDPATGDVVFQLDHEVRSMRHPFFGRQLVNRDPAISQGNYAQGYDGLSPSLPV
ncbi:MAG: hypothetical protein RLZ98_574 [Pseudomonadota bacterium]